MLTYKDWIKEIDLNIDYFSAFIKAWIAFNSWYRSEYTKRRDRDIIEKVKAQGNRFKGYIETFLDKNNNSEKALAFRESLSKLQEALVNATIPTQERGGVAQQISFSEIAINNPKSIAEGDYRQTHYKVQRSHQGVVTIISKKNNTAVELFHFEQEAYDESVLDAHPDFKKLGIEQQGQCHAFYKQIRPYNTESVLTKDRENNIIFIPERSKVSRGIIEVLYLLRCSLMHGEVYPDANSSEVYKYAYLLLPAVLKELR